MSCSIVHERNIFVRIRLLVWLEGLQTSIEVSGAKPEISSHNPAKKREKVRTVAAAI